MAWETSLSSYEIPTVEDFEEAASEPDAQDEKFKEMKKLGMSVEFCAPRRWLGSRELSVVEEEESFMDLVVQTMRYWRWIHSGRRTNARRRAEDLNINERGRIEIDGYRALRICYPSVHDGDMMIKEIIRSTPSWSYGQNTDWKKSRFDTVLVRYQEIEGGHQMASRRVARVLLFFSCMMGDQVRKLAYVQLFQVVLQDKPSGMYKVKKDAARFDVIEIETIERGVHLIPVSGGFDTKMANGTTAPALDLYSDFWINNHIDLHMYNTVFF
jgi:hypothetical protein